MTKWFNGRFDPNATYRIIMQPAGYGKARAELERRMGKCNPKKCSD